MNIEISKRTIYESEAIIKGNESLIGVGLWNIGNELKIIRDNKSYKEKGYSNFEEYAENELSYKRRHCYNFISISENYNVQSIAQIPQLGITKLLSLGQLEPEERESFIEENPVEDMTTRELRQAIKDKKELESKIEELKNKEPTVIEKEVEKIPDDYNYYKESTEKLQNQVRNLKRNLEDKEMNLENIKSEISILERKAKLNEDDSIKYKQLKNQIENLSKQKDDLGRQIQSRTELSGLVVRIENILKTELAPVKYSRAINEAKDDEIVMNNLNEIVGRVQDWCDEMNKYTSNTNIIQAEVINYD